MFFADAVFVFVREARALGASVIGMTVPGVPVPWPRATPSIRRRRNGQPFVALHNDDAYEAHKARLAFAGTAVMRQARRFAAHDGPCAVGMRFVGSPPKRSKPDALWATKPDVDNLEKTVLDGLNGVFWRDDARVFHVVKTKLYDVAPRTEIACAFF
jgi:Holliday junction resolvase RusA-like endonuclease